MNKIELLISEGNAALTNRIYHRTFDQKTYYNLSLFEHFKTTKNQSKLLKLIWAQGVDSKCDKLELALMCPDVCPVFGTPLDYGRGFNRVFNPAVDNDDGYYQPTIDHKIARSNSGLDDISNFIIVSRKANQWKSDMSSKEEFDHFVKGMNNTYFTDSDGNTICTINSNQS